MSPILEATLASTLGAAFLGLYGITSLQTWMYFSYNFKDERFFRSSVLFLWVLDTLHIVFLTATMYRYVVVDFGNIPGTLIPTWSLVAMIIDTLISNLLVRAIFVSGGRWLIPVCVVNVLSLLVLGDGIFFSIEGLSVGNLLKIHSSALEWSFYAGFTAEVIADAIITISLCILLVRMRTGLEKTDSLIAVMMQYSINTGLLTSICAMLILIMYATLVHNFVFFAFYFIYSKLYVNSLLATLNARRTRLIQRILATPDAAPVRGSIMTDMEFKSGDCGPSGAPTQLSTVIELGGRLAASSANQSDDYC
ncbi:hypothetical protein BD413DRAFT_615950 [Trametes elegans]|nr:hypothetical protein BD413DRAFT_615950 [Trametes elegans]